MQENAKPLQKELRSYVDENYGIFKHVNKIHCVRQFPLYLYATELNLNDDDKLFWGEGFNSEQAEVRSYISAYGEFYRSINQEYAGYEFVLSTDPEDAVKQLYCTYMLHNFLESSTLDVSCISNLKTDILSEVVKDVLSVTEMKLEFYYNKNNIIVIKGVANAIEVYGVGAGTNIYKALENAQINFIKNCNFAYVSHGVPSLNIEGNISFNELDDRNTVFEKNIVKQIHLFEPIVTESELSLFGLKTPEMKTLNRTVFWPEKFMSKEYVGIVVDGMKDGIRSRDFHELTKMRTIHNLSDFMYDLTTVTTELKSLTTRSWYSSPLIKEIPLLDVSGIRTQPIEEIILNRRSFRDYTGGEMTLLELSRILYYTYGITGEIQNKACDNLPLRAVPVGGGLYTNEINLLVQNVESLKKGVYRYNPKRHSLIYMKAIHENQSLGEVSGYKEMIDNASVIFVISSLISRNQWKYKERGYRIMNIDCGHIAQNIHLLATTDRIASCCIMGFIDNMLDSIIGLDGIQEKSMYMIAAGVRLVK